MQDSFEGLRANCTEGAATNPTTANPRTNHTPVQVMNLEA